MRILVDRDKCAGHGMCEAMAHEFFEVDDDGMLQLLDTPLTEDRRQEVQAAIDSCPEMALTLEG